MIQHCQIMTAITNEIFKFQTMIKTPLVANYTFCSYIIFSNISSFNYMNSIVIQHL